MGQVGDLTDCQETPAPFSPRLVTDCAVWGQIPSIFHPWGLYPLLHAETQENN